MKTYIIVTADGFYPVALLSDQHCQSYADQRPGTLRAFCLGDGVIKRDRPEENLSVHVGAYLEGIKCAENNTGFAAGHPSWHQDQAALDFKSGYAEGLQLHGRS